MLFIKLIIYEFALWILALFSLPKFLFSLIFQKKYRGSFVRRFGFAKEKKFEHPSIWIHAVSLGETKAVASLARELKKSYPENPLIISTITETGHAESKKAIPFADHHVYLPFDFSWIVYRVIKQVKPKLVVLCETDFWPNFLYFSKRQGAYITLVNGKISEKSMKRFRLLSFFSKALFNFFDLICVQNELYQKRFVQAGVGEHKITITGNLKFDDDYPRFSQEEILQWKNKLGIKPEQFVLTIGSTHSPEEKILLLEIKEVWKKNPHLFVILVPRHPERFKEVERLLEKEKLPYEKFSNLKTNAKRERLLLLDAMGLLRMCYQLSHFTIIGGSFIERVGGHNILEPCWYGKPVLFGPHMHGQKELVRLIEHYQAGLQVKTTEVRHQLEQWLQNPFSAEQVGKKGLHLVCHLKGSVQRTMYALQNSLLNISQGQ